VIFFSVGFPLRHSFGRVHFRFVVRWLGVSALVGGRIFSAFVVAGAVSVVGLPAAVFAADEISPAANHSTEVAPQGSDISDGEPSDNASSKPEPNNFEEDRVPPGGWQSQPITIERR